MLGRPQHEPPWPFRINRKSLQAQGLEAWWPGVEGGRSQLNELQRGNRFTFDSPSVHSISQPIGGGSSVNLNGSTDHATSAFVSRLVPDPAFSITSWLYVPEPLTCSSANGWPPLLYWGSAALGQSFYFAPARNRTGMLGGGAPGDFFIGIFSGGVVATGTPVNQWYFGAWTRRPTASIYTGNVLYINGQSQSLATDTVLNTATVPAIPAQPYQLGGVAANGNANYRFFDLRVYNRTLTAAEVQHIYNPATRWELYKTNRTIPRFFVPASLAPQIITPDSAPSEELTGLPVVYAEGQISLTPTTAVFRGGTRLRVFGSALDVSQLADDLSGTLNPIWTDASSGSGASSARVGAIVLDTGATAGSRAAVRTVDTAFDLDVDATFRTTQDTRPRDRGINSVAELRLTSAILQLTFRVQRTAARRELVLETQVRGEVTGTTRTLAAQAGDDVKLRLLRAGRNVTLFLADAEIFRFEWFADEIALELALENDAALTSRVRADVIAYSRRPVVLLGADPVRDLLLVGRNYAQGSTPEVSPALRVVDVRITGTTQVVLPDAFTFTLEDDLIRFQTGAGTFVTITNDPALTKRRS